VQPGPPSKSTSKSTSKVDAANRLLADGAYAGEPAAASAGAQDVVTVDLLKRLDMKVDFAAVDDSLMVELLPPAVAAEYLMLTRRRGVHAA
jgi:hypothetical protein